MTVDTKISLWYVLSQILKKTGTRLSTKFEEEDDDDDEEEEAEKEKKKRIKLCCKW